MECTKIRITDNNKDFEPFEIESKSEIGIEKKLLDWFLECVDFKITKEMVENTLNVTIEEMEFRD